MAQALEPLKGADSCGEVAGNGNGDSKTLTETEIVSGMSQSDAEHGPLHIGKPAWLKSPIPTGGTYFRIKRDLRARGLHTVCEEAKCPNISQCWNNATATFMVLGDTCTRACRFCHIKTGNPGGFLNPHEPEETARSAQVMGLKYAVITMVDRDDLPDGGASHVAAVIDRVRALNDGIKIEILAGDFRGDLDALRVMAAARPEVFAHNLETVERLTPRVRDARASYRQSLKVLQEFKSLAAYDVFLKSGLMLGLGESMEEVEQTLVDLREHGCDFITIGQYMRPTKRHLSIKRWVTPEEFTAVGAFALKLGFKGVASAPLVRSSYRAHEFYQGAVGGVS